MVLVPEQSRQATYDVDNVDKGQSSSEESDIADDSWYYSDDSTISKAYWNFVTKHRTCKMKNYLLDKGKYDKCFCFGQKCDLIVKGTPCTIYREGGKGVY